MPSHPAICSVTEAACSPTFFSNREYHNMATTNLTEAEIEALKESLRRCSPEAVEAAIAFRQTQDANLVPTVVTGIIERFLEPDLKPLMHKGDDSLELFADLGVDSLTMMEIVIMVEETLGISVENEELRSLKTIGEVKQFIRTKLGKAN
jgi:acyl carrier protein